MTPNGIPVESASDSRPPGAAADYSRFVQRIRRRYPAHLDLIPAGLPNTRAMAHAFEALRQDGLDVNAALRLTRHLVLERLTALDCEHGLALSLVTTAMTELAEFALETASQESLRTLDDLHGHPMAADAPTVPGGFLAWASLVHENSMFPAILI